MGKRAGEAELFSTMKGEKLELLKQPMREGTEYKVRRKKSKAMRPCGRRPQCRVHLARTVYMRGDFCGHQ